MAHAEPGVAGVNRSDGFSGEGASLPNLENYAIVYVPVVVRWQKTAALGGCFRHPFHQSPTRTPGRFSLFLGSRAPSAQGASNSDPLLTFLDISLSLPFPPLRNYFGPTSSVPKMDLSPSTLCIMARGIYRAVSPTGLRPRLPLHRRPLSSGVYSLFSGTQASSHECTTITAPPCPFSSTLD